GPAGEHPGRRNAARVGQRDKQAPCVLLCLRRAVRHGCAGGTGCGSRHRLPRPRRPRRLEEGRRYGHTLIRWEGSEMEALELLVGRESAMKLSAPGPDQEALEKMFESALRAPDHGRLRPWRFVVVPEEKRERFGDLMADCLRRQQPDPP